MLGNAFGTCCVGQSSQRGDPFLRFLLLNVTRYLQDNQLTTLPVGLFDGLDQLKYL